MPFTFAHPAIVLPFKNAPVRYFSYTALIVGSMTPDFEYFIRMHDFGIYGHTLAGLFWFDIPLGLILFYIYQLLVKDQLIDHLPKFLNMRLSGLRGVQAYESIAGRFAVVVFSVWLGAVSHLLWDSFTHRFGYFVIIIPFLSNAVYVGHGHYLAVYNLLQYASSLFGLMIIGIVIMRSPKNTDTRGKNLLGYWLTVIAVLILTLVVKFETGLHLRKYVVVIVCTISGGLMGLIVASVCVDRNRDKMQV
jgi:hypothetical protein